MFKKLLLGTVVIGGITAFILRKRRGEGYDDDDIDSAEYGEFGSRGAPVPEHEMSPVQPRHDATPEAVSIAARVETSLAAIRAAWPGVTEEDVKSAEDDLDRLSGLIAARTGDPVQGVRERLDGIIAEQTPDSSHPAQ